MERLTNDDFRLLIPHLPLADIFLIDIDCPITKKWKKAIELIDPVILRYRCNICNLNIVGPKTLVSHLEGKKHAFSLENCGQFYHPVYTYLKNDRKIASGAKVSPEALALSEKKCKDQLKNYPRKIFIEAMEMGDEAEKKIIELDKRFPSEASKRTPNKPKIVYSAQDIAEQAKRRRARGDAAATQKNALLHKESKVAESKDDGEEVKQEKIGENEPAEGDSAEMEEISIVQKEQPTDEAIVCVDITNDCEDNEVVDITDSNDKDAQNAAEEGNDNMEEATGEENVKEQNISEDMDNCVTEALLNVLEEANDVEMIAPEAPVISGNSTESKTETENSQTENIEKDNKEAKTGDIKKEVNLDENKEKLKRRQPAQFIDARAALEMAKIHPKSNSKKARKPSSTRIEKEKSDTPTEDNKPSSSTSKNNNDENKLQGLIGIEYVLKLTKSADDPKPTYECCLCEVRHSETGMQRHLMGYVHRLKYCEINYPSCLARYKKYIGPMSKSDSERVLHPILNKLAVAIESYHGHDLPFECPQHLYLENRESVIAKTHSLRHACENYGPSFTNAISRDEIKKFIKDRFKFKIPDLSNVEIKFYKRAPGVFYLGMKGNKVSSKAVESNISSSTPKQLDLSRGKRRRSPSPFVPRRDRNSDTKRRSLSPNSRRRKRQRSRSPSSSNRNHSSNLGKLSEYSRSSVSPLRDGDVWQAYRHLVDRNMETIDRLYNEYRQDPENHPQYDEEWNKFWRMRKSQLISQGVDHRSYNYQPEWVHYFKSRIEDLYANAIENVKIESRKRLCLPMTNENLRDRKYHVQDTQAVNMVSYPIGNMPSLTSTTFPINANNNVEQNMGLRNQPPHHIPNNNSNNLGNRVQQHGMPPIQQQAQYQRQQMHPDTNYNMDMGQERVMKNPIPSFNPLERNRGNPTVLSVLRLMTALEDHLGSLGPKIIDLLTKSLTAEKTHPTQVESMILTPKNCTLLETAMEKLKGVMLAGLLDGIKVRAFTRVISDTEQLLAYAEEQRAKGLSEATPMGKVSGGTGPMNVTQPKVTSFSNSTINDYVRSMGSGSGSGSGGGASNVGGLWQNLQNIRRNMDFNQSQNQNMGMNPEKDIRSNNFTKMGMDIKGVGVGGGGGNMNMDNISGFNNYTTTGRHFNSNSSGVAGGSGGGVGVVNVPDRNQMNKYTFAQSQNNELGVGGGGRPGGNYCGQSGGNSTIGSWSNRSNNFSSSGGGGGAGGVGSNGNDNFNMNNMSRSMSGNNNFNSSGMDMGMGSSGRNQNWLSSANLAPNSSINPRSSVGSRGSVTANSNWRSN